MIQRATLSPRCAIVHTLPEWWITQYNSTKGETNRTRAYRSRLGRDRCTSALVQKLVFISILLWRAFHDRIYQSFSSALLKPYALRVGMFFFLKNVRNKRAQNRQRTQLSAQQIPFKVFFFLRDRERDAALFRSERSVFSATGKIRKAGRPLTSDAGANYLKMP